MKRPGRMFWATYTGIAALGIGGGVFFASIGTALLLFRSAIEPFMPAAFSTLSWVPGIHGHLVYSTVDYPWVTGYIYFFAIFWAACCALAAYLKPGSDRRIDIYLKRNQQLQNTPATMREYAPPRRDPPST